MKSSLAFLNLVTCMLTLFPIEFYVIILSHQLPTLVAALMGKALAGLVSGSGVMSVLKYLVA